MLVLFNFLTVFIANSFLKAYLIVKVNKRESIGTPILRSCLFPLSPPSADTTIVHFQQQTTFTVDDVLNGGSLDMHKKSLGHSATNQPFSPTNEFLHIHIYLETVFKLFSLLLLQWNHSVV